MMRTMAVWLGAVLMVGGVGSVSAINQGLADEPAAPSRASEGTGGAAGNETGGSDAVPPVVEGEPAPPAEAGEVQARAVPQLVRLQNHWKPYQYVNIESGAVVAGPIFVGWVSARWTLEPVAPGSAQYWIRNVWQPDRLLNIESGTLVAGGVYPGWLSARWTLEPVAGTVPTLYRIRNFWKPDQYLNIESGALQASAIQPGWLSAMWTLSFDATVVAAPTVTPPPAVQPAQTAPTAPTVTGAGTTGVTGTTGPTTGTVKPPDRYTAPTVNLTAVANAIRLRHKSLTTLVTVEPNVPVTQPVEISIGYYSPAGNNRITQSYVRATGNRFLYNDREGDGNPRRMLVQISLMEPNPGGQPYTFSLQWQADLDPLYDVAVSPFQFNQTDNCDLIGKGQIKFTWWSPDKLEHNFYFEGQGYTIFIQPFAWAQREVSALRDFRIPHFYFTEHDDFHPTFGFLIPIKSPSETKLVPGKTQRITGKLTDESEINKRDCSANYRFTITYTLRWYPEP